MILQTALVLAAVAPAGEDLQSQLLTFAPLIFLFGALYFFFLRPQQQRAKEHLARMKAVKRGDTVVMSNGMIGKVVRVEDEEVGVEIAQNVTVKVIKTMLQEVRTRGEPAANDTKKS
jgi:preprotein translocase subunit YajC